MDKIALKKKRITRRSFIIKKKIRMNKDILRLCISKGNRNLYVQIIDDQKQQTLVAMSTLSKDFRNEKQGEQGRGKGSGKIVG